MATIGYAQLPVPAGGDAPDVPGDLTALAAVIDPHLWQHVEDQADRDETLSGAPVQTVAVAEDGSTWIMTGSGWITVWEPVPAWRSITLQAAFSEGDSTLGIRRIGNLVYIKGRIARTDAALITNPNAVNLAAVPTDCIPPDLRTWPGTCSMAGTTTDAAGRLEVLGTSSTSAYGDTGDILWWYQGTDGTFWIDISGFYWLD